MMKSAAGQFGSRQGHVDGCVAAVGNIYFVDEPQVVHVYRNLRVEYGFQHGNYFLFYFKFGHIRTVCWFSEANLKILIETTKNVHTTLQRSFVIKTVISAVCDYNVVNQADVHGLRAFLYELRQPAVVHAGMRVSRRMVVYQRNLCGALQQCFAQDASYIGAGLVDAAPADSYFIDDTGSLVEQEHPELFYGEVAQQRMEDFVDVVGRVYHGAFRMLLLFSAFTQFEGGHDGDAFWRVRDL